MKKLTTILIALIMCFSSILFTACNDEKYWENTYGTLNQLLQNEELTEVCSSNILLYTKNSVNLRTELSSNNLYENIINEYETITFNLLKIIKEQAGTLLITPSKNTNSIKTKFKSLDSKIQSYKNDISSFLTDKNTFINNIDASKLNSPADNQQINLQFLKEYKRKYRSFINKTIEFCNNFVDLCNVVYYDEINFNEIETVSINSVKNTYYEMLSSILKNAYNFLCEFTVESEPLNLGTFTTNTNFVNSKLDVATSVSVADFKELEQKYNMLNEQSNTFNSALSSLDLANCIFESDTGTYKNLDKSINDNCVVINYYLSFQLN